MPTKTQPVAETPAVEEGVNGKEQNLFQETVRRVLLAGIGAVALTQDEIEKFVDKLIERGEIAEKDGRKMVREVIDRRKKKAEGAEDDFGKRVGQILDHMNVPTKADIDSLGEKITALAKKVDELKKSQS
jgi:polyhydroxyalkanoate synthesis regulator phasin